MLLEYAYNHYVNTDQIIQVQLEEMLVDGFCGKPQKRKYCLTIELMDNQFVYLHYPNAEEREQQLNQIKYAMNGSGKE